MGSHQLALCLVPAVPVGIQLCGGMTQLHTARRSPAFAVRGDERRGPTTGARRLANCGNVRIGLGKPGG
jgi:hypothetical protein